MHNKYFKNMFLKLIEVYIHTNTYDCFIGRGLTVLAESFFLTFIQIFH